MGRAVAILPLLFLLAGCSRERAETSRKIECIKKTAEKVAEDRVADMKMT